MTVCQSRPAGMMGPTWGSSQQSSLEFFLVCFLPAVSFTSRQCPSRKRRLLALDNYQVTHACMLDSFFSSSCHLPCNRALAKLVPLPDWKQYCLRIDCELFANRNDGNRKQGKFTFILLVMNLCKSCCYLGMQ